MEGNSKTESARAVFLIRYTPTQCPLHINEVSWKYLKGFQNYGPHKILQFWETMEDNSWTKSIRVVILARDAPTQCSLQLDKVSWKKLKGYRSYGPHKVSSTDGRTDGQTDARAIAISPEPIGRGIKIQLKQCDPWGTQGMCHWILIIIMKNNIHGLGVGIWIVSELFDFSWNERGRVGQWSQGSQGMWHWMHLIIRNNNT